MMKQNVYVTIAGVLSVAAGIVALCNPLAATLTVVELTSWFFALVGVLQIIAAWRMRGSSFTWWLAMSGVLALFIGYSLFKNPFEGAITLTLLLGILFFCSGTARLFILSKLKGTAWFYPILLSALLSISLALIIFFELTAASSTFLGVMLAIELISLGVSMLSLGLKK